MADGPTIALAALASLGGAGSLIVATVWKLGGTLVTRTGLDEMRDDLRADLERTRNGLKEEHERIRKELSEHEERDEARCLQTNDLSNKQTAALNEVRELLAFLRGKEEGRNPGPPPRR